MISKSFLLKPLAIAALVVAGSACHAALSVYSSSVAFGSAISAPGVDTYTGFLITGTTPSPITRAAGAYTYSAAASTSTFFGAGTTANPWLSTNVATDSITFNGFSPAIKGIGANFFGSDVNGLFLAGNVTLTALDSLGATSTQTITGATVSSFLGFTTNGSITSLTLAAVQTTSPLWPTADNLTLGLAAVVPEPGSYGLLAMGLGMVAFVARRRRA